MAKRIDSLTKKAVEILNEHMTPVEIMTVLQLNRRTAYDLINRVKEKKAKEEAERLERKQRELDETAALAMSLEKERSILRIARRFPNSRFVY